MYEDAEKIKLSDLIDIEFLQAFQDSFSKAMGIACRTFDLDGPITEPSEFCDFCQYIKNTPKCKECSVAIARAAAGKREPVIDKCHMGLTDFVVPIKLKERHIGSILCGQFLTEPLGENHFREIVKRTGMNKGECKSLLRELKIIPIKQVQEAANLLYIVANTVSETAYTNLELKERNERENLLRKILETMRSSLDINEIKSTIVNEICKALNADRCFIILLESLDKNFIIDEYSEYLSSPMEKSYINFNTQDNKVSFFINKYKNKEGFNFENAEEFINENNLQDTPAEKHLREYGSKSVYQIPISYADDLLGYISIAYTHEYRKLSENDLEFLRIIADQAGIAIHQADLYKLTQKQAETEKFSRKILEILRGTLDEEIIKHLFVKSVGQYFHANRVFISDYDPQNNTYLPVTNNSEYLSSSEEKSFAGYDWSKSEIAEYIEPLKEKREFIIYNWEKYIKDNPKNPGFRELFEKANIKSSYTLPVVYQQKMFGLFSIAFAHEPHEFLSEDISRIRNICTQLGIALYQAELYHKAQESAQTKEGIIKNIIEGTTGMLDNIMELSVAMSKTEEQCDNHIKHLNHIAEFADNLLNFINKIKNDVSIS